MMMFTFGLRTYSDNTFSICRASSTGVLPTAVMFSASGVEILPSGRTGTVVDKIGVAPDEDLQRIARTDDVLAPGIGRDLTRVPLAAEAGGAAGAISAAPAAGGFAARHCAMGRLMTISAYTR